MVIIVSQVYVDSPVSAYSGVTPHNMIGNQAQIGFSLSRQEEGWQGRRWLGKHLVREGMAQLKRLREWWPVGVAR